MAGSFVWGRSTGSSLAPGPPKPPAPVKPVAPPKSPYWDAGYGDFNGRGIIGVSQYKPIPGFPTPTQPAAQPPAAQPAPKPATPAATPGQPASQPSPLDSTYYQQLADANFKVNNQLNTLDQQGAYGAIDLQSALGRLQRQQPIDTLNAQEKYNRQGLLYSGHLGQALGQLNQNYLDKQSGDVQTFARQQAARDAAEHAARAGLSRTQIALRAAAAERATALAAKDTTLGESSAPLVPAAKAAVGAVAAKPAAGLGLPPGFKPTKAGVTPGPGGTTLYNGQKYTLGGFGFNSLGSARPTPNPALWPKPKATAAPKRSSVWGRSSGSSFR